MGARKWPHKSLDSRLRIAAFADCPSTILRDSTLRYRDADFFPGIGIVIIE